jgi:hypothetical protein
VTSAGEFNSIFSFTGASGAIPGAVPGPGALLRHTDGWFYGGSTQGGVTASGLPAGELYRFLPDPVPITRSAENIGAASATLRGSLHPNNRPADVYFDYDQEPGLPAPLTMFVASVPAGVAPADFAITLTGLLASRTYFFRLRAVDPATGNSHYGSTLSFSTFAAGFPGWIQSFGFGGAAAESASDPDTDGWPNGVEYVLGGNPSVPDNPGAPSAALSNGALRVAFYRSDVSETNGVALSVIVGMTLKDFPEVYEVGASTETSSPGVTIEENGEAPDTVTVEVPANGANRRFARLAVSISTAASP